MFNINNYDNNYNYIIYNFSENDGSSVPRMIKNYINSNNKILIIIIIIGVDPEGSGVAMPRFLNGVGG